MFESTILFINLRNCKTLHSILVKSFSSQRQKSLADLLLKMPKEKQLDSLKSQREKLKIKRSKYAPGRVSLQVLGSGAKGAPHSLYVFTDQSRYLFNCGEGTQRLAHEHKMKLSKLEHIFLTHSSWEKIGGLPGVALTLQDVGVPEIILHGPRGIQEVFSATRRFIVLKNMSIRMADCTKGYEDTAIKISHVPLKSSKPQLINEKTTQETVESDDDVDYYAYDSFRTANESNGKKRKFSPLTVLGDTSGEAEDIAMCYICEVQPRPGSLMLEKCVEKGVPTGPLLGKLKNGEDIVLDNGKVVRSTEVTSPPEIGPLFIVVDCPRRDYLDSLITSKEIEPHQCQVNQEKLPAYVVVHFTPQDIIEDPLYKSWMDKFSPSTQHLILNESNYCMGSVAVHRIQHKLNLLDPSLFPMLKDNGFIKEPTSDLHKEFSVVRGKTFKAVQLRPAAIVDGEPLKLNREEYLDEVYRVEGFKEELTKLKENLASHSTEEHFPNVLFLGTGSCIPNKTRNTSGILLNISKSTSVLLDCGEGTYGQLVRFYGREEVDEVLAKLKAVYVSHLHADHHIGLNSVLKARAKVSSDTLFLLAPGQIMTWLNLYNKKFENILNNVKVIRNGDMLLFNYQVPDDLKTHLEDTLEGTQVRTAYVKHCPNAFGVSLESSEGWKITYSGDCMPSDNLITLGKGSDLLIHEATMEDELKEEAFLKMHSTTSQAIEVGRKMGAKFTLLTHFSQRYAKLPRINESFTSSVGFAFDNMVVGLKDLWKLNLLTPALKLMFQEECEELELKAAKRQMKLEREANKL